MEVHEYIADLHFYSTCQQSMGKYSGQKHPPPGGGGFNSGVPKKNKGQISTLLFALLARSANVLHLLKKYTFLSFRLIKLPF